MSYAFLQQYWWFVVSLLGALLVFMLFVQGANSMVHSIGHTEEGQRKVLASTGLKWEITFTTLVTFGGAFFASFPLFYSTSLLWHQLRRRLLALDDYSLLLRAASRQL